MRRSRGFTLLELMIALAVFALMVTLSYSSASMLMDANRNMQGKQAALQQLQRAWVMLERDVHQMVLRKANMGYGEKSPAVQALDDAGALLEFTRGGNPDMGWELRQEGQMRSSLQRVRYVLEKGVLVRQSWNLIDRADSQEAVGLALLEGVKDVGIRFMDERKEWRDEWPEGKTLLPAALEITLEHDNFGEMKRVLLAHP